MKTVVLPYGASLEMTWKQVKYINHNNFIVFEIIPMYRTADIIVIPNKEKWKRIQSYFNLEEREEIIFFLQQVNWKRDIKIVELNIEAYVDRELSIKKGMIEATEGYCILASKNLFDFNSELSKEQVKEIYCRLEKRFAEAMKGVVRIPQELMIEGSIMNEVTIPVLKGNPNVILEIL